MTDEPTSTEQNPVADDCPNERFVSFSYKDVIALAQAVAEPENHCAYDGYIDRYSCTYCDHEHLEAHKIKHALDCPVLIAIDLLT